MAPSAVSRRCDDGQQVPHLVTAERSVAQIAAQRAGKNSCAIRVPSLKLNIDEPAQVIGRRNRECRHAWVGVAYLLEERPQDAQSLSPRVLRKASGVLHVPVEATQFVLDWIGRLAPGNGADIL